MNKRIVTLVFIISSLTAVGLGAQEKRQTGDLPFQRMDHYTWKEFARIVPAAVDTVILPVGTQEAHGVAANGADALVPERLAQMVAPGAQSLIAPVIPYGLTTSLAAYPGGFAISREAFHAYCRDVLIGLATCGFRNIVVFNGHGPNRAPLDEAAAEVSATRHVRILVIDWWSYCAGVTQEIWGTDEDGGHAGLNENAAVQAVDPRFVRPDLYEKEMAVANDKSYSAFPNGGTILLYSAGKGYPDFDQAKADRYLARVAEELTKLIIETRARWEHSGIR